jgi:hypothetical protein
MNRNEILMAASNGFLFLAVSALWMLPNGERVSSALTCGWIISSLLRDNTAKMWRMGLVLLVIINLRAIIMGDGPRPVSNVDYLIIVASFLGNAEQSQKRWGQISGCLSIAVAAGGAANTTQLVAALVDASQNFSLGILLINQTALLSGLGCIAGLSSLMLIGRHWSYPLTAPATIICGLMTVGTHSRAGIALILLACALAIVMHWIASGKAFYRSKAINAITKRLLGFALAFIVIGLSIASVQYKTTLESNQADHRSPSIVRVYGQDNLTSDLGRLAIWKCYAELPYRGNNSFLMGVGFGRSRQLCPVRLAGMQKPLSHSHNIFLQIWAESGTIAFIASLSIVFVLARMVWKKQGINIAGAAVLMLFFYPFAFNLVELGMLKLPLLTAVYGSLLSIATARFPKQARLLVKASEN